MSNHEFVSPSELIRTSGKIQKDLNNIIDNLVGNVPVENMQRTLPELIFIATDLRHDEYSIAEALEIMKEIGKKVNRLTEDIDLYLHRVEWLNDYGKGRKKYRYYA